MEKKKHKQYGEREQTLCHLQKAYCRPTGVGQGLVRGLNMGDYCDDVTAATDRSFDTQREGGIRGLGPAGVPGRQYAK